MSSYLNCFICLNKLTLKAECKQTEIKDCEIKLRLKPTIQKIFQYLHIPAKDFNQVYSSLKSQPSFCPDCSISVQQIVEIQKKVTALELLIQNKVETIGKVIAASVSKLVSLEKGKIRTEEDELLWDKFRNPVLQNHVQGILHTPSILMSKCNHLSITSMKIDYDNLPINPDLNQSSFSEIPEKSTSTIKTMIKPKLKPKETSCYAERDEEVIPATEQVSLEKSKIRKKIKKKKFINPVIQNLPMPITSMKDVSNLKIKHVHFEDSDSTSNMSFDSDSSLFSEIVNSKSKSIKVSLPTLSPISAPAKSSPKQKWKYVSSEEEEEEEEETTDKSQKEEKDYFECSLCPFKSIIELGNGKYYVASNFARTRMISHFNTHHNPVKKNDISKKDGKEFYSCTLCDFSSPVITNNNDIKLRKMTFKQYKKQKRVLARLTISRHYLAAHHKLKEVKQNGPRKKKQTEEFYKDRDYLECSICSFKTIIKPDRLNFKGANSAQANMYSHFNTHHNPVKINDVSEGAIGDEFYKCTLCEFFSSVIETEMRKENLKQRRALARLKLSRHYLKAHYKFKVVKANACNVSKENSKSPKKAKSSNEPRLAKLETKIVKAEKPLPLKEEVKSEICYAPSSLRLIMRNVKQNKNISNSKM